MNKLSTIATLFFLATPVPLFATAQIMETIIIDGNEHRMASLPLNTYFTASRTERLKREIRDYFEPLHTACWRGYVGTWEIKEDHLWLLSLHGAKGDIPLSELFEGKEPPIKADWFTGMLRVVKGEALVYIHAGFESIYERDLFIDILDGKVVSQRISVNEKPLAFQQPPLVTALIAKDSTQALELLRDGADPNARNIDNPRHTPLYLAIKKEMYEVADLLVNAGADVSDKVFDIYYLLLLLARNGQHSLLLDMLNKGAPLNAPYARGNREVASLLYAVISNGNPVLALELINRGASYDEMFDRPIDAALFNHFNGVVRALVDKGVDVNARMDHDPALAPLAYAARTGNLEGMKILYDNDVEADIGAYKGTTRGMRFYFRSAYEEFRRRGGKIGTIGKIRFGATFSEDNIHRTLRSADGDFIITCSADGTAEGKFQNQTVNGTWEMCQSHTQVFVDLRSDTRHISLRMARYIDTNQIVMILPSAPDVHLEGLQYIPLTAE